MRTQSRPTSPTSRPSPGPESHSVLKSAKSARATGTDEVEGSDSMLPAFCEIPVVFTVVVIGQLLAFTMVLQTTDMAHWREHFWRELALISLFVQWVGLSSVALLCALRGRLRRLRAPWGAWICFALVLAITASATVVGHWLFGAPGDLRGQPLPGYWFEQLVQDAGEGLWNSLIKNLI